MRQVKTGEAETFSDENQVGNEEEIERKQIEIETSGYKAEISKEKRHLLESSDDRTILETRESSSEASFFSFIARADKLNVLSVLTVIVAVATITFIGVDECRRCFNEEKFSIPTEAFRNLNTISSENSKSFMTYGRNIESGFLRHVLEVLDRLGYKNESSTEWDLLWAHDYPFRALYQQLKELKEHQLVNHFPGCGYLTNKVDLATSRLKFIPPAFKLPKDKNELLTYAETHPKKSFVVKNNEHRHVQVKKLNEIDLNSNDSFVQEFIDKPLLIDGHMFDIGIYTIITSIDPLRVYIYHGDFLLRFCPEKYHPFDPDNLNKYIVGDDYLPTWEVPTLKYYYNNLGFGMRESLSAYLSARGQNAEVIWAQIEESIRIVTLAKEPLILDVIQRFKSKRNFFEMMRFDFIVDDKLGVHLLEANMSPNLSSAHFKPNRLLYEQVIYNLFGLVGIGTRLRRNPISRSKAEELMQTADKNLAVLPAECSSDLCKNDCDHFDCLLCKNCLDLELRKDLVNAHKEHLNRGDCKRVFPPTMIHGVPFDETKFDEYSLNNQLMYRWFHSKCQIDSTWCD